MMNIKWIYKIFPFIICLGIIGTLIYFGYSKIIANKNTNINDNISSDTKEKLSNSFSFPEIDKKSLIKFIKKDEFGENYIDQEIVKNLIYNLILNSNDNSSQLDFDFVQKSNTEIEVYIEVIYQNEKYYKVYEIKI